MEENASCKPTYEWCSTDQVKSVLGSLTFKSKDNACLENTPELAMSSILRTQNGEKFVLFVSNFAENEIEAWEITMATKLTAKFAGKILVPGSSAWSKMSCDCAARDVINLPGDVTYFFLFVTCPDIGSVRYIRLECDLSWLENFSSISMTNEFKHPGLHSPSSVTSYRGCDVTVAIICGSSGIIFYFKFFEESGGNNNSVTELKKFARKRHPTLCAMATDARGYTYVTSAQNDDVTEINPTQLDEKVFKFAEGIHGISIKQTDTETTLLGTVTKHNRVVALSGHKKNDVISTPAIGLKNPRGILSVSDLVILSGRSTGTNSAKVLFFNF
ncbi:uncharacterized protein LOC144744652 [Ciona intestinalis]